MAGKRLGQRDKKGLTVVPLHVHDPVGPHIHPIDDVRRPPCEFVHRHRCPHLGTNSPLSFPSSMATHSSSLFTVGSSPNTSSPTLAPAIAARSRWHGRVTVSLRRSTVEASVTSGVDPYERCCWACLGMWLVVLVAVLKVLEPCARCCWVRVKPCVGVGLVVVLVALGVLVEVGVIVLLWPTQ